jgi:hypothetical protein
MSTNPLETRIKLNRYDNYGNILEQQKINDVEKFIYGAIMANIPLRKLPEVILIQLLIYFRNQL